LLREVGKREAWKTIVSISIAVAEVLTAIWVLIVDVCFWLQRACEVGHKSDVLYLIEVLLRQVQLAVVCVNQDLLLFVPGSDRQRVLLQTHEHFPV
jgi:hypothetical protein